MKLKMGCDGAAAAADDDDDDNADNACCVLFAIGAAFQHLGWS